MDPSFIVYIFYVVYVLTIYIFLDFTIFVTYHMCYMNCNVHFTSLRRLGEYIIGFLQYIYGDISAENTFLHSIQGLYINCFAGCPLLLLVQTIYIYFFFYKRKCLSPENCSNIYIFIIYFLTCVRNIYIYVRCYKQWAHIMEPWLKFCIKIPVPTVIQFL